VLNSEWDGPSLTLLYSLGHGSAAAQSRGSRCCHLLLFSPLFFFFVSLSRCPATCTSVAAHPGTPQWLTRPNTSTPEWGRDRPGAVCVKLAAALARYVYVRSADGSYLMLPGELVTAIPGRLKRTIVLVDSHGFHSIFVALSRLGYFAVLLRTPYPFLSQWLAFLDMRGDDAPRPHLR